MLSSTAPKSATASNAQNTARPTTPILSRKVWLPKVFYDSVPYFYLVAGAIAFFTTLYISEWFWVLPHYLLFSVACLHFGIFVLRRRHRAIRDINEPDQHDYNSSKRT
jgi:hypothetical protein